MSFFFFLFSQCFGNMSEACFTVCLKLVEDEAPLLGHQLNDKILLCFAPSCCSTEKSQMLNVQKIINTTFL